MRAMAGVVVSVWLLVSNGAYVDDNAAPVAGGVVVSRIIYDGSSAYAPGPGLALLPDDGTAVGAATPQYGH